jgi:predicted HTH domain antitoxin
LHSENRHLTGRVSKSHIEKLERISKEEKIDRSSVLRKVLDIGLDEYDRRKAVEEYRRGKLSVGKAAELAGISIAEFYKILENEDIPIRIDIKGIKLSLESDFGKK